MKLSELESFIGLAKHEYGDIDIKFSNYQGDNEIPGIIFDVIEWNVFPAREKGSNKIEGYYFCLYGEDGQIFDQEETDA